MIIKINQLKQDFKIGCTAEERAFPQMLLFNIELQVDCEKAQTSDDLVDTIDYMLVAEKIEHFAQENTWNLLEKLATDLANFLKSEFPKVIAVKLEIFKDVLERAESVSILFDS